MYIQCMSSLMMIGMSKFKIRDSTCIALLFLPIVYPSKSSEGFTLEGFHSVRSNYMSARIPSTRVAQEFYPANTVPLVLPW